MNRSTFISDLAHEDQFVVHLIADNIDNEGWCYTDHSSDLGGATGYGLSSVYNPDLATKIKSQSLTAQDVFDRYRTKYYERSYAALAHRDGMDGVSKLVFECAVTGHRDVIRQLQYIVNDSTDTQLVCDGRYGPRTNSALLTCVNKGTYKMVFDRLLSMSGSIGARAAYRVKRAQASAGIDAYDYTVGFTNRISRIIDYARMDKYV